MKKKLNYLFIGVDQVRFDTLGFNGNDICATPNLDKLAKESFNFDKAYTTAPLCSPARASMFTGKYGFNHKMGTNCDMYHSLSAELENPDDLLHYKLLDAGFNCGFTGKWHVGTNKGPVDYGFEGQNVHGYGNLRVEQEYKDYLKENNLEYTISNEIYHNTENRTMQAAHWNGSEESTTEHFMTNETIKLLEKYSKESEEDDKPFFMTCQYWGPHGPHFPPTSFINTTDRSKIEPWINFEDDNEGKPNFVKRHLRDFYRKPPENWEEWREIIGLYYDFMSYIDKEIGRVLDSLEELGLKDNTVVFFTTDHGDMKGVHGGLIDKGFLYEEAMHIPFLMYHPEHEGGKTVSDFVYNMDILPTVLAEAGLDSGEIDGKSIMPALKGQGMDRECAYMEFHGIRFLYSQRAVVSKDNYKYIFTPGDFDELYNLNDDIGEMKNLIDDEDYAEVRDRMQGHLKELSVNHRDPLMDYVYKITGDWQNPSGKIDISNTK